MAASTIITIEIGALKKGTRAVTVSGAPAGEMPVVVTGTYADLHQLVNTVWSQLQRRQPQVPVIKETKAKGVVVGKTLEPVNAKPAPARDADSSTYPGDDDDNDDEVATVSDPAPAETTGDQLVASVAAESEIETQATEADEILPE